MPLMPTEAVLDVKLASFCDSILRAGFRECQDFQALNSGGGAECCPISQNPDEPLFTS
jgi:hypothetical protein